MRAARLRTLHPLAASPHIFFDERGDHPASESQCEPVVRSRRPAPGNGHCETAGPVNKSSFLAFIRCFSAKPKWRGQKRFIAFCQINGDLCGESGANAQETSRLPLRQRKILCLNDTICKRSSETPDAAALLQPLERAGAAALLRSAFPSLRTAHYQCAFHIRAVLLQPSKVILRWALPIELRVS